MLYGITEKAYSQDRRRITHLKIVPIVNNNVGTYSIQTREHVISLIESGNEFWTLIFKNNQWNLGAKVEVVLTIHGKYLRTDKNNISEDNLENLPEFSMPQYSYKY